MRNDRFKNFNRRRDIPADWRRRVLRTARRHKRVSSTRCVGRRARRHPLWPATPRRPTKTPRGLCVDYPPKIARRATEWRKSLVRESPSHGIEAERLRQGCQTFETNRDRPIIADNGVVSCVGQIANVVLTGSKATKHNQNWQFSVRQGIGEADDDSDIAEGGAA